MKSKITPLIEKEIKDLLRDPRIYIGLIIPIFILPLMGFIFSLSTESTIQIIKEGIPIALLDYDKTDWSLDLINFLSNSGFNITYVDFDRYSEINILLKDLEKSNIQALIIIPKNFGENITKFSKSNIETYYFIKSGGISETSILSMINSILKKYSDVLSLRLISYITSDRKPENLKDPLKIDSLSVVGGKVLSISPEVLVGQIMMQSMIIPITLLILTISVAQTAATATAIENEERTLETLLTFPVSRYGILLAKLMGSAIIAIIGAILYLAGYYVYLERMLTIFGETGIEGGTILSLSLPLPSIEAYIVLGINVLLAIFFTTSLGVVIGALSSDVRISNSFLGVLIIPVMIPAFLIIYGGEIRTLPLIAQIIIYALPTSYPLISTRKIFLGSIPIEAIYGIPYSTILTLIVIYLTGKILSPEKLLTLQYKIKVRRVRKKELIV
ncbi:MAG: ABC transporter permease [Nitrososphaerota archaeon]